MHRPVHPETLDHYGTPDGFAGFEIETKSQINIQCPKISVLPLNFTKFPVSDRTDLALQTHRMMLECESELGQEDIQYEQGELVCSKFICKLGNP